MLRKGAQWEPSFINFFSKNIMLLLLDLCIFKISLSFFINFFMIFFKTVYINFSFFNGLFYCQFELSASKQFLPSSNEIFLFMIHIFLPFGFLSSLLLSVKQLYGLMQLIYSWFFHLTTHPSLIQLLFLYFPLGNGLSGS